MQRMSVYMLCYVSSFHKIMPFFTYFILFLLCTWERVYVRQAESGNVLLWYDFYGCHAIRKVLLYTTYTYKNMYKPARRQSISNSHINQLCKFFSLPFLRKICIYYLFFSVSLLLLLLNHSPMLPVCWIRTLLQDIKQSSSLYSCNTFFGGASHRYDYHL